MQVVNANTSKPHITGSQSVYRQDGPGVVLSMSDGSRWFHPYGGGAPVRERAAPVPLSNTVESHRND
jgi:hypothetical protein